MPGTDCVLSTSRLTKAFGKLVAVNDLHLEVMRGDVFGFLGPNGSGKTTTIRMLLGLIRPTAGRVVVFGMDTRIPDACYSGARGGYRGNARLLSVSLGKR